MKRVLPLCAALAAPAMAAERAVEKVAIVAAPLQAVWEAWTTREGIVSFFAPDAKVEARVDGPFEIYFNPYAPAGLKGADDMRYLAIQDRKMLSFTWNAPPHLPEVRGQRTVVVVRFRPNGEQETEVSLHHGGWGEGGQWDQAYTYFDRAWGSVLANLQKRFVERKPIDWTPFAARMKEQAAKMAPAKP